MKIIIAFMVSGLFVLFMTRQANGQTMQKVYESGSGVFEIEQILGGDIDDSESFLYLPYDLVLDSNGNLFVLDNKGCCIKKYDSEGNHLKTFGSKGEGPGDMLQARCMSIDPDENIVIFDSNLSRFTIYDNSGNYINSINLTEFGYRVLDDFDIHPNGTYILESRYYDINYRNDPSLIKITQYCLDSKLETPIDSARIKESVYRMETRQRYILPFHPRLRWGITPSGNIVVANSEDCAIKIYSQDLTLIKSNQIKQKPRKVTDEEIIEYFEDYDEEELIWMKNNIIMPKFKPFFETLLLDQNGNMILELDRWSPDKKEQKYDVLDSDGHFINRIVLPRLMKSSIIRDTYIYTIDLQEEDYAIYKYKIN